MTRGNRAESWHRGAAAVVTPEGRLVAKVGSPAVETYLRSAAKPFQALPLVLSGGVERLRLSAADLALICASHDGTAAHVERAESLLARHGIAQGRLQCGSHRPYDVASAEALEAAGLRPSVLHNNCSGKHTGMLLACQLMGWPFDDYLDPDHPLQQRILEELAAACRIDGGDIGVGVDGCNAPSFVLSLEAAAGGFAALADPEAAGTNAERSSALRTVFDAMTTAPDMVSGPGNFTTRLMEVTRGRVLGKEGAEGIYAVAIRGPVALGMVLKIADGASRAWPGVVLDLLRQLGSLSREEMAAMEVFHGGVIKNRRGVEVGRVVPDVELEETSAPVASSEA